MSYAIRYNLRTAHLQGVAPRTVYTGDGEDNGSGVVPYYAESACGTLSRSSIRLATRTTEADALAAAVRDLREFATERGLKVCANCNRAAEAGLEAEQSDQAPTPEATPEVATAPAAVARPAHHRVNLYRIENPHTGAVEFPEYTGLAQSWAVYARNVEGRSYLVAYSNADNEAAAIEVVSRHGIFDTDYAAALLHTTTAGDRDAYLARRAILEDGTAERAKWASVLTSAAVDYLRTPHDDTDSVIAKQHVSDMVDQAMHHLGADVINRQHYREIATRIVAGADAAARWFLIVERALDQRTQIEGVKRNLAEVIERDLVGYLTRRDALIGRIEAIALAIASHERTGY